MATNPLDALRQRTALVTEALAHLRLVAQNNPTGTAAQINQRPDVRDALAVITGWITDASRAAQQIIAALPTGVAEDIARDTADTLERLTQDTAMTDAHLADWAVAEPEAAAAKVMLRMQWLLDFLGKQADLAAIAEPYKRWVSRLAPNTCRYCRGLHGAVIPAGASFAFEARSVGFTRPYGGLYGPPLHPRCQCWLEPVSQAQYQAIAA